MSCDIWQPIKNDQMAESGGRNAWCGFSTSNFNVLLLNASLFSRIVPERPCIFIGALNSQGPYALTNLNPRRSPLNRAWTIVLSLSSNITKSSWTFSWESPRVASFKYHTLNSDWTPRAAEWLSLRQTPPCQRIIWCEKSKPATEDCRGQVF